MDYSAQCINIVSTNPDCVFLAVEGDYMGTCVKQLRQYGFEGTIISREELSIPQQEVAGDAMNGYAFPSLYVSWPSLEEAKPNVNEQMYSYLESYYNEYGELPASIWAYEVWDAMMTLQQAAKLAGSNDPAALRDAMNQLTYTGIGGTIDYTDGRHESYSADAFNVFIYEDGKVVRFTSKRFASYSLRQPAICVPEGFFTPFSADPSDWNRFTYDLTPREGGYPC